MHCPPNETSDQIKTRPFTSGCFDPEPLVSSLPQNRVKRYRSPLHGAKAEQHSTDNATILKICLGQIPKKPCNHHLVPFFCFFFLSSGDAGTL
jgi:hypothetical protein